MMYSEILLLVMLVAHIHDYKFLNQKYQGEQVRVSEIYVSHEKYKGFNP